MRRDLSSSFYSLPSLAFRAIAGASAPLYKIQQPTKSTNNTKKKVKANQPADPPDGALQEQIESTPLMCSFPGVQGPSRSK